MEDAGGFDMAEDAVHAVFWHARLCGDIDKRRRHREKHVRDSESEVEL